MIDKKFQLLYTRCIQVEIEIGRRLKHGNYGGMPSEHAKQEA
jgi:hypothetical protein